MSIKFWIFLFLYSHSPCLYVSKRYVIAKEVLYYVNRFWYNIVTKLAFEILCFISKIILEKRGVLVGFFCRQLFSMVILQEKWLFGVAIELTQHFYPKRFFYYISLIVVVV